MSPRRLFAMVSLACAMPAAARAQGVRGVVVDAADRPIPGVVVLLVDGASQVVARALSDANGEFRVSATRAGAYHVRTLRIGYRPVVVGPYVLTERDTTTRLVLSSVPVVLDTVRTTTRKLCGAFSDSSTATFAVWEQIRGALAAAELTAASRTLMATTIAHELTLDPTRGATVVTRRNATVSTGYVTRPWRTLAPDSLRRVGYVVPQRDGSVVYYAPGLDMLLSDAFIEDHCFRLTTGREADGLIGIAFEPTPQRRRVPEIRGTLWVNRASSELRQLEFRYVNVLPEQEQWAGGEIDFAHLRDGTWAITSWGIRMPVIEQNVRSFGGFRTESRVTAVQVTGGDLALVRRGSDTLWTRPPIVLFGVVRDSATSKPIEGAHVALNNTAFEATTTNDGRFTLTGVIPGSYTLSIRTPALDSLGVTYQQRMTVIDDTRFELRVPDRARRALAATFRGVVVTDSSSEPIAGAEVSLVDLGKTVLTDSAGAFRITDIPAGEHRVLVRRMGYGAADTRVTFTGREVVERRVVLGRAVELAPVTVSERASDPFMRGFEEHRRVGLGQFMVREQLERFTAMNLNAVLEGQLSDVATLHGPHGELWITSRRSPQPAGCFGDSACLVSRGVFVPDRKDRLRGVPVACFAQIYLDGILLNSREPAEPVDLHEFAPDRLEAIEYYAGPAQTPPEYSRLGSPCGVLALWTRRR